MTAATAPSFNRNRAIEFGASAAIHVVLIAGLSVVLLNPPKPPPPPAPMDVTLADDVGLVATAPQNVTPPAQSQAPELGKPEDAAPAAPSPEPQPAPAKPAPAPRIAEPAPPQPKPAPVPPPRTAAAVKPQPQKPAPAAAPKPQPAKPQARPAPSGALAGVVGRTGSGTTPGAVNRTPKGSSLGGVMNGLGATPNNSKSTAPQAAMTGAARASINGKIAEQIQPCALNHKLPPTPGIDRVRVIVRLSFARDGNLSAAPEIVRIEGLNDDTQRYADLVRRSALATFSDRACLPIRGLPAELYDVPGGWRSVPLGFRLPG